jgi:hypothetical protein
MPQTELSGLSVAFQPSDLLQNTFMTVWILIYCCRVFGTFIIVKGARGMTVGTGAGCALLTD